MKNARLGSIVVGALLFSGDAQADIIRIATWNIEHLRAENGVGSVRREDDDFAMLSLLAEELDADIVALQEIDGPEAAARVFDPTEYAFFFSDRNNVQRTGFAVRRGIEVTLDSDFVDLALDGGLRRGTDIIVEVDSVEIRLMSVHMKSGCFDRPIDSSSNACRRLAQQIPVLESWIDDRAAEEIPFIVLGDFNRRFNVPGEGVLPDLDDDTPNPTGLVNVTATVGESGCLDGRFPEYIDHILLDDQAAEFLVDGSFGQIMITEDDAEEFALSDHCPIFVDLAISGDGERSVEEEALEVFADVVRRSEELNARIQELERLVEILTREE